MRKIILFFMILVSISFAYAAVEDDIVLNLHLDEITGDALDTSGFGYDFTVNEATQGVPSKNTTFGTAYKFNGTNEYLNKSHETFMNFEGDGIHYNFSLCLFVNITGAGANQVILSSYDAGGGFAIQFGTTSLINFLTSQAGTTSQVNLASTDEPFSDKWKQICVIRNNNGTNLTIIEDNYFNQSNAAVTARKMTDTDPLNIGRRPTADRYFNGTIDEVIIWNRSIGTAEVLAHYEGRIGGGNPTFENPTPPDETANKTQVIINVSCDTGYNVTLWFDSNTNPITTVINNKSSPSDYTTSVTIEDTYYYKASCNFDAANAYNTSVRSWTYDITSPNIAINPNNFFKSDNSSNVSRINDNYLNLTLTDNIELYGIFINITNSTDTIFSYENITLSGTSADIYKFVNLSNASLSLYNVSITVSDSHTDENIDNYDPKKTASKVDYNTAEGNNIFVYSEEPSISDTTMFNDRYSFSFDFYDNEIGDKHFHIVSDKKIDYIKDSSYKAHFVVWNNKILGGNWIDFEGAEGKPIIEKIDDYHYKITFKSMGGYVDFNSIGGLNIKTNYYSFRVASAYPFNLKTYISGLEIFNHAGEYNQSDSINLTSHVNTILDNECSCVGCVIDGNYCEIPISYISDENSLLSVNLTNASIATNLTINIYDREKNVLIEELTQIIIKNYDNYSTETGIVNIQDFSIDSISYTIIAESDNYITDQKQFTLTDKNSTTVNIYLVNSTSDFTGNLIVQVFDEFFNYIVGANVKLLEYKTTLDSFVEVSQCFSDSNGECIFDVELDTTYYIIQATYTRDNEVLFAQSTEEGQLIKIDNTIIELHLRTTERFEVEELFDLTIIPSNTELTGNTSFLTATFNDNTNREHTVCIGYYTQNGLNEVEQDITCVTASAGIVNYAGGYLLDRDFVWIAKIYVIEENGKERVYNSYTYDATEDTFLSSFEGYLLKPILFAILLASLAVSLYLKNMKIFAFMCMGFSVLTLKFYPNYIGGITMSFIIILCLCILYLTSKKQEMN